MSAVVAFTISYEYFLSLLRSPFNAIELSANYFIIKKKYVHHTGEYQYSFTLRTQD